jgi:hypothetical protein
VHTTGLVPVHFPFWQASVWVHRSPSLQPVPSSFVGLVQTPVAGVQVPTLWHWSRAVQTTGLLPVQVPLWHVSVWVHRLPSLQPVPFGLIGFEHSPVAGVQVPASWHWSSAVHTTGFEPTHVPLWQASVWVHKLLSLQLPLSVTVVVATAELFPVFGSVVELETVAVLVITVPFPAHQFTLTTIVKIADPLAARLDAEQLIVPVPPTDGVEQVQPAAGEIDWKVVFVGVGSLSCGLVAAFGPLFVTVTV